MIQLRLLTVFGGLALAGVALGQSPPSNTSSMDRFSQMDTNGDGSLDADELSQRPALVRLLTSADSDADGKLSREEVRKASKRFPALAQLLGDARAPAAPGDSDRANRPRQPLNNAPIDPRWGPDIEPKKSDIAFTFEPDFTPGTKDAAGNVFGGTELMRLTAYDGKLFAAVGYFGQDPAKRRVPGGQVLRKDAAGGPWVVEATFADYVRVDTLVELVFTVDADGKPLATPAPMLVAGLWWKKVKPWGTPEDERTSVAVRDDSTGKWTVVTISTASNGSPGDVRSLQMHTDRVTGRQYLFAGCGDGRIYRAVFDAAAPGRLRWEVDPGLPKTARLVCLTVCDGTLFVAGGLVENNGETPSRGRVTAEEIRREGGLYRRVDGPDSRWELAYRWPFAGPRFNEHLMRGISVVPDPADPSKPMILGGLEDPPLIQRIDPVTGKATDELNFMKYFQRVFGSRPNPGRWVFPVMFNQLEPFTDPRSGERMHLVTTGLMHPKSPEAPHNGAWFLIRRLDGTYEHAEIYPKDGPLSLPSGRSLNGVRTIVESPFPLESGKVWYFGGYGADRSFMHDTAWIYRGTVSGN
jgi:hypothetical protein